MDIPREAYFQIFKIMSLMKMVDINARRKRNHRLKSNDYSLFCFLQTVRASSLPKSCLICGFFRGTVQS